MEVMSEQFDTEEEFYQDAKQWLSSLGVSRPTVGEPGKIPVNPGTHEVLEVNITESTSQLQKVANEFPRHESERIVLGSQQPLGSYGGPICNNVGCGILNLLPRECSYTETTWTDPDISGRVVPDVIPEATAYLNPFNARIEGEVSGDFSNFSDPGEKHTQEIFKCKEDGQKETEVQEDSAILDMTGDDRFNDVGNGEFIADVVHEVTGLEAKAEETDEVTFRKEGALETLRGIIDVWSTGTMRGNFDGTLSVSYEWKGSNRSKDFDIDVTARVPVQDLNYSW